MSDVWSGEIVDKALNAVRYFFLMAVLASVFSLYKHFIQIFWQERIDQRRHPLCLTAKRLRIDSLVFFLAYLYFLSVTCRLSRVDEHRRRYERIKDPWRVVIIGVNLHADHQMKLDTLSIES